MARLPRWTDNLTRIVRDRSGNTIETRDDARRYILALPEFRQRRVTWQHAARLLVDGASADAVTSQIETALFADGDLAITK